MASPPRRNYGPGVDVLRVGKFQSSAIFPPSRRRTRAICRRAWRLEVEPTVNCLRQFGQDGFDSSKALFNPCKGLLVPPIGFLGLTTELRDFLVGLGHAGQESRLDLGLGRQVLLHVGLGLKHLGEGLLHRPERLFRRHRMVFGILRRAGRKEDQRQTEAGGCAHDCSYSTILHRRDRTAPKN